MNAPTYLEWATWFLILGLLGFVIPMLARFCGSAFRASSAQQTIWRGAFLVLLIVSVGESFGTYGTFIKWWTSSDRIVGTWSVPIATEPLVGIAEEVEPGSPVVSRLVESRETPWLHSQTWIPGLIFLGGIGCGLAYWVFLRLGLALYVFRYSLPANEPTIRCFQETVSRLNYKGNCRLRVSSGTLGPFAFGTLRPTILIPVQLVNDFSDEESALVFAHEVAHLKNRDNVWQPLVDFVTLLFWWHPMIWWARRHLVASGEFAADSRAVSADYSPKSLAACLVKFGRRAWAQHRLSMLFQNGTAFHSALGHRVERLLQGSVAEDFRGSGRLALSTGMVLFMAVFYIAFSRVAFPGLVAATPVGQVVFEQSTTPAGEFQEIVESNADPKGFQIKDFQNVSSIQDADESAQGTSLEGATSVKERIRNEVAENPNTGGLTSVNLNDSDPDGVKPKFLTRRYRLDSQRAISVIREILEIDSETVIDQSNLQLMFRRLFRSAGVTVPLEVSKFGDQSKAAIFFNDQTGMLFVRVLEKEFDGLEEMAILLNESPPQVAISIEMVDIPMGVLSRLVEDYPFLKANETNPDELHSIFDESEFKRLRETFLTREVGVDVLGAPKITTLSGRPAQLSMTQRQSIVFSPDHKQGNGTPLFPESKAVSANDSNGKIPYETRSVEIGPSIRILPSVSPSGYEIDIDIQFTMREFVGYDDPGPAMVVIDGGEKQMSRQIIPLPRFRERETKASMRVQDGQVVMLRGMTSTNIRKKKDKVPLLGDIPLLGRLFRRETTEKEEKQLLIFVKAFQIDPAGNRLFPPRESK